MATYDLLPRDQPAWDSVEAEAQSWRGWLIGRIYSSRFSRIEARLRLLLSEMEEGTWGLNVGSSNTRIHPHLINLDIRPSSQVDIVGSALCLPFQDNSLHFVVSQEVLEHLPDPELAVRETYRALAPGGLFYLQTPFLVGIHDWPHDYWRFTDRGLEMILKRAGFLVDEIQLTEGAGRSMYLATVEYFAAIAASISKRLYTPAKGVAAVLASPLKLANLVTRKMSSYNRIPVGFYAVARKPL
jgi:SAM-dependent methyltransferase